MFDSYRVDTDRYLYEQELLYEALCDEVIGEDDDEEPVYDDDGEF